MNDLFMRLIFGFLTMNLGSHSLLVGIVFAIACATEVLGAISIRTDLNYIKAGQVVQVSISSSEGVKAFLFFLILVLDTTVFWPFVRSLQWGAYVTCHAPCTNASLLLPLPLTDDNDIVVVVLQTPFSTPFPVGQPLPNVTALSSNIVRVNVLPRSKHDAHHDTHHTHSKDRVDDTFLVGMEWEPWFTAHNWVWNLHEAVPLVGLYDSFNEAVLLQHVYWMVDAGVDFLVVDWTNNLWGVPHWADRGVYAQEIINATTFTLAAYESLRRAGVATPRIVLLLGLDNGPQESIQCLLEEVPSANVLDISHAPSAKPPRFSRQVDWIAQNYLTNFSSEAWVQYEGKPLLVIFDGGRLTTVHDGRWGHLPRVAAYSRCLHPAVDGLTAADGRSCKGSNVLLFSKPPKRTFLSAPCDLHTPDIVPLRLHLPLVPPLSLHSGATGRGWMAHWPLSPS
jgi:hypothetical protein